MPFFLERGGENNPLEVQRWQYFLRKNNVTQTGAIDAQFGMKTEEATKIFQLQHSLPTTGKFDEATLQIAQGLGYTVRSDNFYDNKTGGNFPPKPTNLESPSNADRNAALGCFRFIQLPLGNRGDKDEVVPKDSCDHTIPDWRNANIVDLPIPQMKFVTGFSGIMRCHKLVAPHLLLLFARWEELDLLHLLRHYDGDYNPRYKRDQSPGNGGHGIKQSNQVSALSNHAFGSAFDVNERDNGFGDEPARCPRRGCVRELVEPANELGFYWGGHFSSGSQDGMHFEFAKF